MLTLVLIILVLLIIDSMKTLILRLADFNYVLSLGFRSRSTKLHVEICD